MCSRWLCGVVYRHCVALSGTVWCGFGGMSVQQVVCGVCISALRVFVKDSLMWVWGNECAAGGFVVFVYRHCVCAVCGTV